LTLAFLRRFLEATDAHNCWTKVYVNLWRSCWSREALDVRLKSGDDTFRFLILAIKLLAEATQLLALAGR
jgi:hypothetical protein